MPTIDKLLTLARRELGVKEAPAGSNRVKYNTAYYGREVSVGAKTKRSGGKVSTAPFLTERRHK